MTSAAMRLFLATCLTPAAYAQFELYVVKGVVELPAPAVYDLGAVYPNETATARFRLRNTSMTPAAVYVLAADGAGFMIPGAPALPFGLDPQAALEFTVAFRSVNTGSYSAALHSEGVSILLTATVLPRLTYTVEGQTLSAVNFGKTEAGSSVVRHFAIENLTPLVLTVPLIAITGNGFTLVGDTPSGSVLQPRQTAHFDTQFQPPSAGSYEGSLIIGDRTYALSGTGADPPPPRPVISLTLADPRSARQGSVTVNLDAVPRSSGAGTLTLEFHATPAGANDPGITFLTGSRNVPFTVTPGDMQVLDAPFQTGTTAGILTFTATLAGNTDQQSITIAAAPVGILSAKGTRLAATPEVLITGFDNTRTAGALDYTFFDTGGNPVSPGAIHVDSTADFTKFFQSSDAGGNFLLRSIFPVNGDPSRIVAVEVEFTNSAGTARTGRIAF
jgi:hypothetical protein